MLCEKCKKRTATVFYNENINGKVRSFSLCSDCAAKMREKGELQDITSMVGSFADPFSEMQDHFFGSFFGLPALSVGRSKSCPTCKTTYEELAATGLVGCPDCYKTFERELESTIGAAQGTTQHKGRVPARDRAKKKLEDKLQELRKKLDSAIEKEEYEEAAKLRDEIRSLNADAASHKKNGREAS